MEVIYIYLDHGRNNGRDLLQLRSLSERRLFSVGVCVLLGAARQAHNLLCCSPRDTRITTIDDVGTGTTAYGTPTRERECVDDDPIIHFLYIYIY